MTLGRPEESEATIPALGIALTAAWTLSDLSPGFLTWWDSEDAGVPLTYPQCLEFCHQGSHLGFSIAPLLEKQLRNPEHSQARVWWPPSPTEALGLSLFPPFSL